MSGLLFRSVNKTTPAPTISVGDLTVNSTGGGVFGGGSAYGVTWGALEPTVYHNGTKFMMWYNRVKSNSDFSNIFYCESTDGETWTNQTELGIIGNGVEVYFDGTYYHMLICTGYTAPQINYYRSTSPNSGFSLVQAGVITNSGTSYNSVWNPSIYYEGGTFYVTFDGRDPAASYQGNLATGSSLTSLTKQGAFAAMGDMGECLVKSGGAYYSAGHQDDGSVTLPSSLMWYQASSILPLSGWGAARKGWLARIYNSNNTDQLADPFVIEVNGTTHLFYEQIPDQIDFTQFRMCHATYPGTVADFYRACLNSPISDTRPTLSSGKVTMTLNTGASIASVTMDGAAATQVGSAGSVTTGTYYQSGTTLILGTSGKSVVKLTPGGSLTIGASSTWTQTGTTITANDARVGTRSTVSATVYSTAGGRLVFSGTYASRFSASLDNSTWAQSVVVPAGSSTVYLGVTRQAGDPTLTAKVGVPL